jgi:hypothetical protein
MLDKSDNQSALDLPVNAIKLPGAARWLVNPNRGLVRELVFDNR